jgi:hypothetical protein
MFWTSMPVPKTAQVEMEAGSLNIAGRLVAPFGRHSDAYDIVRPRAFMNCKAHYDDDDDDDDMILFKNII